MNSFTYYRSRLSDVIQIPRSLSHTLQIRLTHSHIRFNTSDHHPEDVNPPVEQLRRFPIPRDCVLVRRAALDYLSEITLSMGFSLNPSELDRIVSCIYSAEEIAGGGVEASVSILRTDVIIGGDESHSDEKMIPRRRPGPGFFHASKKVYKNITKLKIEGKDGDSCPITDGMRNVIKTCCTHLFHHECCREWLNGRADCPICGAVINFI